MAWLRFRSTELLSLFFAIVISVAALTSVAFLADRLQNAFERDAKKIIASDVLLQSDQLIDKLFVNRARDQGLKMAQTVVFPTMVSFSNQSSLVALKAVSETYPLRGELKVSLTNSLDSFATKEIPEKGSVWVDPALLASLKIQVGDFVSVGQSRLRVAGLITQELDRGAGFLNFAPRLMMRLDELDRTGLIGFGSRVTYTLLLAGDDAAIQEYSVWAKNQIIENDLKGIKVQGIDNSQPFMRSTLDRAEKFLSLVAILTAMVSAVAIALAAKRYVSRQASATAIWKCLGASKKQVLLDHFKTTLFLAISGGALGAILGWLGHEVLLSILGDLLVANLPAPSIGPVVWAFSVAFVLLIGFVWPPILALSRVSPLIVLRQDQIQVTASPLVLFFAGMISFILLLSAVARDGYLALVTLLGFLLATIIFLAASYGLMKLSTYLLSSLLSARQFSLRYALQSLSRRAFSTSIQVASLSIAIMALLLLSIVRHDLLGAWQTHSAENTPNRFLINIQADQKNTVKEILFSEGIKDLNLYPMVRGRLVKVNGIDVNPNTYADEKAQRLIDREFNLSYGSVLPYGNKILQGQWHGNASGSELSIEQGIAKTLNLHLGDQLEFDVAGNMIQVKISSIRKLDWSSLRVNFFAILSPGILENQPQSWITAYRQIDRVSGVSPVDIRLVGLFPNITVLNVDASLAQLTSILNKLSLAIELLFLWTLCAGVLVLISTLALSQDERLKDAALLKVMGASKQQLQAAFYLELSAIGFISGLLASLGSLAVEWFLAHDLFELNESISFSPILYGIISGVLVCVLGGLILQRRIATIPAVDILRKS